jgi:antitoxin VapB
MKSQVRRPVGACVSPCGNIQLLYIEYSNLRMVAMSLYIRDAKVNELADEVMRRLGTKTKTEAVRVALENELKRAGEKLSLEERIRPLQDRIAALGPKDPDFDEKAFMDEMWEI